MEIVHFPIHKEGVFTVATLPEGIAIAHKNQGVAFVKNTVGAATTGSMVTDLDGNSKIWLGLRSLAPGPMSAKVSGDAP